MQNDVPVSSGRRRYDAHARRERAQSERAATRARVIEAAGDLFATKGYTATTMTEIAQASGLSMQSVYTAGNSKADLLRAVVERAVAGDDRAVLVHDRTESQRVAHEPDAEQQLRMIADRISDVQERTMTIQIAFREAAAVDPAVAEAFTATQLHRLESFEAIIKMMPKDRLRHTPKATAHTLWAIGSTEVFLLLRRTLGWSAPRYRTWLAQTLIDQLLLER